MRLGVFLLAAIGCCVASQECLVGNILVNSGTIFYKSVEYKQCEGLCRKQTVTVGLNSVALLTCEDNKLEAFINQDQNCDVGLLENSCYCEKEHCNRLDMPEEIPTPAEIDLADNILCYVGFAASNQFSSGDVVRCATNSACVKVNGTYMDMQAEVYACMPVLVCTTLLGSQNTVGTQCANLNSTNILGCCCYDADCTSLTVGGNVPTPLPTPQPFGDNNIQCYQGLMLNGVPFMNGNGNFYNCQGDCGSIRLRTTFNNQVLWGEVFVCDPVNVFTAVNVDNQCRTIDSTNVTGVPTALLTACACGSDKCIDPTVVPPVYPIRQLKCAVGLYNGSTWLGAEMNCNGRCGRMKFKVDNMPVSYYTCAPYSVCAGFGLESSEGVTYNPPQDEELEFYCCSAWNNCNVDDPNIARNVNTSVVSTANYPILCYGGIWVNGSPITQSAYGLCQGECASASFVTTFAGQTHNATVFTCDPVTMCSQAGIRNACGTVFNNVTACCCGNDLCIDPNRGSAQPTQRCYAGISSTDGYNQGGDMFCDGWCGSLNSIVNSTNVTAYFCAPVGLCRYFGLGFGGNGNCNSIVGADPPVIGCCCSDSDNCLAPVGVNVTAIPARKDPKIVCFEGLYLNGQNISDPYYRICDGECVSIQMGGTINSTTQFATLYTCDPSSACAAMGVRNNCSLVDNAVSVCCCDSDECIDPTVSRVPGRDLKCYVGVKSTFNSISVGAEISCNGYCASVATTVADNNQVVAFHCAPRSLCRSLGLDNSNNTLYLDRAVTAYCCDTADYCNIVGYNINTTGITQPKEQPRACYQGVFVNNAPVSTAGWTACQGDCVSISLNTTYLNMPATASLYTCDPTVVCRGLNVSNSCTNVELGVEACCCDSDACIDPTVTPPRKPFGPGIFCYVGIYSFDSSNNTIVNAGAGTYCQGTCASVTGKIANNAVTVNAYACVPNYVCSYLSLWDDCMPIYADRSMSGCCCTNGFNCNLNQLSPRPPPLPEPRRGREFPITCPQGLIVNGQFVTRMDFTVCTGDCASVSINGTIGTASHTATLFTCDPTTVCQQLNLTNNCGTPETGLSGCCCNTDACLDPYRGKFIPTPPLKCYVGIYSTVNSALRTGAEIMCDGKCASVNANVGNDNATVFACVPHTLCRSLELYDECANMGPPYPEFRACCCDNFDNCNVYQARLERAINTSIPISPLREFPISCYSGLFLNGTAVSDAGWISCQGECASLSLTSSFRGIVGTAALYTCDPTRICRTLGIVNNCTTLENGVTGCCCNTGACLDPSKNPPRTPGNPLVCYAGIRSNFTVNGTALDVGTSIYCNGKCSSLSGMVNGYQVHSYHCVPITVCSALGGVYDFCQRLDGDRGILGCCCDNVNNCNINGTNIVPLPPSPNVDYGIACYSGLYVNGTAVAPPTLDVCQGQCASISITTTFMGQLGTATLFGCDPTVVCQALGMNNACAVPEDGVVGCCCDSDLCLDPTKNLLVPAATRNCYAGIFYKGKPVGAQVSCNGKCASLSANINGDPVTAFGCVPSQLCHTLQLYDACNQINLDRAITGCCCDNGDNCNIALAGFDNKTITPGNPPDNLQNFPIACYSGLFINKTAVADAGWQACLGECASVSLTTTFNNTYATGTLYLCDPVQVCSSLGVMNNCQTMETGLDGCCCNTNACLNPLRDPPKQPGNPLQCYVGIRSTYNNINVGAATNCDGQCASLSAVVSGETVTTYHCVPSVICTTLEVFNTCKTQTLDRDVTLCCCDDKNNCNVNDPSINVTQPDPNTDFPIACYQGLVLNGQAATPITTSACYGQCASLQLTTTLANGTNTAVLYTCDPTAVCQQLNMTNGCATPEPGVTGCCCNTDGCINPYTNTLPGPLSCYVGIYTDDGKVNAGATVPCDGYCGSINTTYMGVLYKSYHCVPKTICSTLELNNAYRTISTDRDVTAYCCTTGNNCHVKEPKVNVNNTATPSDTVIACQSAVYLNGVTVTGDFYTACAGSCASITYNTTVAGQTNVATLYTCDPTSVCSSLNINNNCMTLDAGLSGCCCNSDVCVTPSKQPQGGFASNAVLPLFTALVAVYIALTRQ